MINKDMYKLDYRVMEYEINFKLEKYESAEKAAKLAGDYEMAFYNNGACKALLELNIFIQEWKNDEKFSDYILSKMK